MTKRTITVNEEYRLVLSADNVMIERLTTVDPTNAVNWAKKEVEGADPAPYEEWRNIGKYFGNIPKALTYLQEYSVRLGDATNLVEVLAEMQAFRRHIDAVLGVEESTHD